MTISVLDDAVAYEPEFTSAIVVEFSGDVLSAVHGGASLVVFVELTEHPARNIVGLGCG